MNLRWKDTVRTDLKAWNIREEWATVTDRERLSQHREAAAKGQNIAIVQTKPCNASVLIFRREWWKRREKRCTFGEL